MTLGRFLTSEQVEQRLGIDRVTLWRLAKRGDGPPRLRLTPGVRGRWGYPEIPFEQWLLNRLDKPIEGALPRNIRKLTGELAASTV